MSNSAMAAATEVLLALNDKLLEKRMRSVDLFRKIDESGDGVVSPEEFLAGLEKFGFSTSSNEFEALMKVLDRDGDGEVDFREFDKAIKKAVKQESAEAKQKRLAADLALEPAEGAVSDGFITTLLEKAQKSSHFFHGFTKNELRGLLKVSQGTIQFATHQTILPPGIKVSWIGLVLQGVVEVRNKNDQEVILAKYKAGSFLRAQPFLDGYHRSSRGKSKTLSGVLKLNPNKKGQRQPVRVGTSVITDPPGSELEYFVGSAADGLVLCWEYASLDLLRESEATKDLAYKFLQRLSHAQSSEYLERIHQTVFRERAAADDVSGSKEAAKVAKMNKRMEEMEAERIKIETMMKKAKEAVHKAKNGEVLRKAMERKLAVAETKLEEAVRHIKGGKGEKDEGSGGSSKKQASDIKKLKKQMKEQANNAKRKLESLRKMLTDQHKKKAQKEEKQLQKKIDNKLNQLREKLAKDKGKEHDEMSNEIASLKTKLAELSEHVQTAQEQAAVASSEAEAAAKSEQIAKENVLKAEETAKKLLEKKGKKSGWGKLKKKHGEESDKKRKARDQFKDVMQQAQKNRLKTIRDEALKQLDATRAMLLSQQNQNKR
jgi:hypothetical protein